MAEVTLTWDNFEEEVTNYQGTVLIDFWATWCGPCKMIAPTIEEIAEECKDVKVCKVNVDEELKLAMKYGVSSIPTLMVFKDGRRMNQMVGLSTREEIESMWK